MNIFRSLIYGALSIFDSMANVLTGSSMTSQYAYNYKAVHTKDSLNKMVDNYNSLEGFRIIDTSWRIEKFNFVNEDTFQDRLTRFLAMQEIKNKPKGGIIIADGIIDVGGMRFASNTISDSNFKNG